MAHESSLGKDGREQKKSQGLKRGYQRYHCTSNSPEESVDSTNSDNKAFEFFGFETNGFSDLDERYVICKMMTKIFKGHKRCMSWTRELS